MTDKKPWLLQTADERAGVDSPPPRGLIDDGLYSAMMKNQELRDEIKRLENNMEEAVRLIRLLDGKIALLNSLNKNAYGKNPNPTTADPK
jgi:hypothetical protein